MNNSDSNKSLSKLNNDVQRIIHQNNKIYKLEVVLPDGSVIMEDHQKKIQDYIKNNPMLENLDFSTRIYINAPNRIMTIKIIPHPISA